MSYHYKADMKEIEKLGFELLKEERMDERREMLADLKRRYEELEME